jgi:hypothetical protein
LTTLALFGVLHALLVFQGDILLAYACRGLLLWPLRQAQPRRLLLIHAAMLHVPALSFALLYTESAGVEDLAVFGLDPASRGYLGSYGIARDPTPTQSEMPTTKLSRNTSFKPPPILNSGRLAPARARRVGALMGPERPISLISPRILLIAATERRCRHRFDP